MKTKSETNPLLNLLVEQLSDAYYAEKQLVKALPKMAKAAKHTELQSAFNDHLEETKNQVTRLEEAFTALGHKARSKKCPAIDGIIKEAEELADEFKDSPAGDAALILAGQKAEHYEIATYGTMVAFAELLGEEKVADLLSETLEEEKAANRGLTDVAESNCNEEALVAEEA